MHCPKCGGENREAARFCDGCGSPLHLQCGSCGALNRVGAQFCYGCGKSLTVSAPFGEVTDLVDGERKTITALFADIKGSMELMEDLDPKKHARSETLVPASGEGMRSCAVDPASQVSQACERPAGLCTLRSRHHRTRMVLRS
jgi:hypothetical protein